MADAVANFHGLSAEVRCQIWELALTADWSVTTFQLVKSGLRIAGKTYHRRVGQICRDAQQLMRYRLTEVEGLGWFQLNQHLFFFRDIAANSSVMSYVADSFDLLPLIQHICINPRSDRHLFRTLELIATKSDSLRTVVILAPWLLPADSDSYCHDPHWAFYDPDWTQKWFRPWPRVDSRSLTDFAWGSLLDMADDGDEIDNSVEEYRFVLEKARLHFSNLLRQLGHMYDVKFNLIHHNVCRELETLDRMQRIFENCPTSPTLFLKSVDQL